MTKATISATAEAHVHKLRSDARNLPVRDWFEIRNTATEGDDPTVYIYAEIGDSCWGDSVSASAFVQEFAAIDSDRIQLHINSPGGDVHDGIAIANAIRSHKAHVVATVDAIAASAASFIAVAADELVMARNSELMIHDAWGLCVGNAVDMRDLADRLDKVSDNIASMYADKAGGDISEWRDVMRDEAWYSAQEAVDAGLADRVDTKKAAADEAKNRFDLTVFAHAGRAAASAPHIRASARSNDVRPEPATTTTPPPEGADMASDTLISGLRERLGIKADAELDDEGLLAAVDEALAETEPDPDVPPGEASIPAGTQLVDQTVLADLIQFRDEQRTQHRASIVEDAIRTGRIPPAKRQDWLNALAADPSSEDTLKSLAPGLIPVEARGHAGSVDAEQKTQADRDYEAVYGKEG